MPENTIKFDEIYSIYSSILEDSSRLYPLNDAEVTLANSKERRHKRPRIITIKPPRWRAWPVKQEYYSCLTEKYDILSNPVHILVFIGHKKKTLWQVCCKGSLWTWTSGISVSSHEYESMKDVRKKIDELQNFYNKHYYVPVEIIEDSANMKKIFQRHRQAGNITRIYATRNQVINYGPLRHLCKQYPNRRQFSLYHINDFLKIIPLSKFMTLDDFKNIERIFSMKEAEQLTGVDRSTIKDWIKKYPIPLKLDGNAYQFKYDDLKMIGRFKGKTPQERTNIIQKRD